MASRRASSEAKRPSESTSENAAPSQLRLRMRALLDRLKQDQLRKSSAPSKSESETEP
jgi:hypothetical protein